MQEVIQGPVSKCYECFAEQDDEVVEDTYNEAQYSGWLV